MKFLGIDHPAIAAEDVEKSADWYCNVIGYEKWVSTDRPVWMLKAPDGTYLEIIPKDDTARPGRTIWTPGYSHLALRVDNLDQAIADLDSKGIEWTSDVFDAIGGGKIRNAVDCDGNMIQILERQVKD